jgi:hypothetical protein
MLLVSLLMGANSDFNTALRAVGSLANESLKNIVVTFWYVAVREFEFSSFSREFDGSAQG